MLVDPKNVHSLKNTIGGDVTAEKLLMVIMQVKTSTKDVLYLILVNMTQFQLTFHSFYILYLTFSYSC